MRKGILTLTVFALLIADIIAYNYKSKPLPQPPKEEIEIKVQIPQFPKISVPTPQYKNYQDIVKQLNDWKKEGKDFVEVNTYGKSKQGKDLYYIRITSPNKKEKPVILLTGSIHGNEPLAAGVMMALCGNLLSSYKDNSQVKNILDTRDIYFVPVVSPDSYPKTRYVDGVDPNRDFPGIKDPNKKSTPSVKAIQDLFLKIKPVAAISGHTFGRIFIYPYGESYKECPDEADYKRILTKMCAMSGYGQKRGCYNYPTLMFGSELDWYYKNNCFSSNQNREYPRQGCFAIVCEFGTHQRIPTKQEIEEEFNRTWKSLLFFIEEAPKVKHTLNPDSSENKDTSQTPVLLLS
jgi:hypothetical protein